MSYLEEIYIVGNHFDNNLKKSRNKNILYINRKAQSYILHSSRKLGLVFFNPDIALLRDICETFYLSLNKIPKLSRNERQIYYLSTYTKIPIIHTIVEPNEWLSLPKEVRGIFQHFILPILLVRLFVFYLLLCVL